MGAVPTLKPAPKRSSVIIAEKHDKPKPKAPEEKVDEGPQPWAGVVAAARAARTEGVPKSVSRKKQKVIPSKFGVSAFVESLCRIAFTYLATYGNDPQVSSCPYVRSVWLVVYLRCVFTNLRQSLEKRTAAQGQKMGEQPKPALSCFKNAFSQGQQAQSFSGIVHESLGKALQGTATQLWDTPQPLCALALRIVQGRIWRCCSNTKCRLAQAPPLCHMGKHRHWRFPLEEATNQLHVRVQRRRQALLGVVEIHRKERQCPHRGLILYRSNQSRLMSP